MPRTLLFILLGVSIALSPVAGFANLPLSKKKPFAIGLILPSILALWCYLSFLLILVRYRLGYALLTLLICNLPLLTSLTVYVRVRLQKNRALANEYRRQRRAGRPPIAASASLHAAIKDFSFDTKLSRETLTEVIILMKAGSTHEKIAATYDCTVYELKAIEKAFDRYLAEKNRGKDGVSYTVSPEQAEFFLQLMTNATPKSLGCGDRLLWSDAGVAKLIRKATQIAPSKKSVASFLQNAGLILQESDIAVTKTPEARRWIGNDYSKIRMSALERETAIYWVYAPKPNTPLAGRRLVLIATASDGSSSFGIYKGSGGFADFLNKLAQEAHKEIYAVVCTDYREYKNLNSLSQDIHLFALGEDVTIPD